MDLSALAITNVKQRAEEVYAGNLAELAFNPVMAETAKAVLANQFAARAQELLQAAPTDNVDIVWNTADNAVAQDCTSDCVLVGTPATGDVLNISAPKCIESVFSVSKESARKNGRTVEEETAFLLARHAIILDNAVNAYTLAQLAAKADAAIAGTLPSYATQAAGVITVPSANWGLQMYADWMLTAIKNRMGMPYVIDDGALYTYIVNAQLQRAQLDGAGNANRAASLNPYEDILGFPNAGLTTVDDFFIKRGAVALFHKTYNDANPTYYAGTVQQNRSVMPSLGIPGISYDMFSSLGCSDITGTKSHSDIGFTHKLKANLGVFKAPGVGGQRPGILALKKGA